MTKVKAVSVRVMELFTIDGTPLGLFAVHDQWQGLHKLVRIPIDTSKEGEDAPCIIVDLPPGADAKVIGPAFGEHRAELDVVKASPDLAMKLK